MQSRGCTWYLRQLNGLIRLKMGMFWAWPFVIMNLSKVTYRTSIFAERFTGLGETKMTISAPSPSNQHVDNELNLASGNRELRTHTGLRARAYTSQPSRLASSTSPPSLTTRSNPLAAIAVSLISTSSVARRMYTVLKPLSRQINHSVICS